MTTADPSQKIKDAVRVLDGQWRRMQLSATDRGELTDEVTTDLEAAALDGMDPAQLLGPDLTGFARDAATSRGYVAKPDAYGRTVLGGLGGLIGTVVLAQLAQQLLWVTLVTWVDLPFRWGGAGGWLILGALMTIGLLGTLTGVKIALRDRWATRATIKRAGLLVPLITPAAGGIAAAYAAHRDVATDPETVIVETTIIAAGYLAALLLARWWALRSAQQPVHSERAYASHE